MSTTTRRDNRRDDQVRAIQISFDCLSRVDGSARFTFGPTGPGALSSVTGPIEVRLAAENPSQATFEVLVRPLSNVPATEAKAFSATLRSLLAPALILSQNPRTLLQLVTQALVSPTSDGLHAAIINASTLALLSAGSVPMQGVVCAVAIGRRRHDSVLIVDPSEQDEPLSSLSAHGCFAFLFHGKIDGSIRKEKCVWTNWKSSTASASFDDSVLAAARDLARQAAVGIYNAIHASVVEMGKDGPNFKHVKVKENQEMDEEGDEEMEI